jgi:hypothetical protein
MAIDAKYGRVEIPGIPDDEPVFILRAQDATAPDAVSLYRGLARAAGASGDHLNAIERARGILVRWQQEHGSKTPDTRGGQEREG